MSTKKQERRRLSDNELATIKNGLLGRKRQVWNEINDDIDEDVREEHQDLIQAARDGGDHGLAELRQSTVYSLIEMKVKEIESIEEALLRIEAGKYGRCRDCSRWIKPARLEVQPFAVRCRNCQAKREK
jgi:DnaK suppressor protein